jgi:STAS domain
LSTPGDEGVWGCGRVGAVFFPSVILAPSSAAVCADSTERRTRFCDASGLHALLAAHKRAHAEGVELLLVIPSAAVLRVLAVTGIDRVIPNFTSLDEALAHTSSNGLNGRRRPDDGPEVGAAKTRARRRGTALAASAE